MVCRVVFQYLFLGFYLFIFKKKINTYSTLSPTIVNASIDEELRSVLRTFLLAFSIGFSGKRVANRAQKLLDFVVRDG